MAIEIKDIISVNADQGRERLRDLRNEINQLRNAIANLDETSEEYKVASEQIYRDQQELAKVMNASKKYVDAEEGSMNALLATLRRLKEQWKATGDEAERNRIGAEVNQVKAQINTMNESIGNYQHNVGNYTNSIVDAFGQMGIKLGGNTTKMMGMFTSLQGGLGKLGKAFKSLWATLSANPIGAVLAAVGALVGVFSTLRNAIKNNEESELRWHEALAAFQPIKDKFKNWLDEMGQGFVNLTAEVANAWEWIRKTYAAYTDWMGYTQGRKERVEAEQAFAREVGRAEGQLIQLERATKRLNTTDENTVSQYRELASMTTDRTKQVEYLTKAREAQQRVNERNIKLAEQEYDLLKKQTSTTNNSIETNNRLLDAELKVTKTKTEGNMALLRLNRQISSGTKALSSHTQKVDENAKALERQREAMLRAHEEARKEAESILREVQDALKSEEELENASYTERLRKLQDFNLDTEALEEEHRRNLAEIRAKAAEAQHAEEVAELEFQEQMRRAQNEQQTTSGNAFNYEEIVARNEAELEAFRALTEAKIALNMELMENYDITSTEYQALLRENALLAQELSNKTYDTEKKNTEAYKKLMKAKQDAAIHFADVGSNMLKNLSSAMGESTKMGKGFAIAAATIDTIAAAVSGFRAGMNQWADAGPMAWMAPVQAAINTAAALAAGYAQVQKITSVDTTGSQQSSAGGTATALAMPNVAGLTSPIEYTRQLTTETEREEMNRDTRVYILESDIQASNRRVRVREAESTF